MGIDSPRHQLATSALVRCGVLFASVLAGASAASAGVGAILDNGTIEIGVDSAASLNLDGGSESAGTGTTIVGLRDVATNLEGVSLGIPYEGWGLADLVSVQSGGAASLVGKAGGTFNLTYVDSGVSGSGTLGESTGDRAYYVYDLYPTVVGPSTEVPIPPLMEITHDFHPSKNPRLYEIEVTIENTSLNAVKPRYRRVVDWDIEPVGTSPNYVTIHYGPSTAVTGSNTDAFNPVDPLTPFGPILSPTRGTSACGANLETIDCVGDIGAGFDFEFPEIPPGGKLRFWLYYGAAPTEAGALAALADVGASAYSLGQSATDGTPMTFMLGFKAPWAIVDNGTVELGIDMFGALNVYGGTYSTGGGVVNPSRVVTLPITGLRDVATNYESLADGVPWEGWGLYNTALGPLAGTASLMATFLSAPAAPTRGSYPFPPRGYGMTPISFDVSGSGTLAESVGRRAIVKTEIDYTGLPLIEVTHDFRPSPIPGLYEILVILDNVSGSDLDPSYYRRIADWDIEPTAGNEFVSNLFGPSDPQILESVDDGLDNTPIPYNYMNFISCHNSFVECGPGDLGMGYDFVIDPIPAGGSEQFLLFYGSGSDIKTLYDNLTGLGAQAASIAESDLMIAGPGLPLPVVFGFGFEDVLFVDDFETGDTSRWSSQAP
jgi:hypothetical protein